MKVGDRVRLVEWPNDQRCMWKRVPGELGTIERIEQFENGQPAYAVRFDFGGATFYLAPESVIVDIEITLFKGVDGNFYRVLPMPGDKYRAFKENDIGAEYLGEFSTKKEALDICYRLATSGGTEHGR